MRGRAVERKAVDDMCAHLRTLNIDAQIAQEDLVQKEGTRTSFGLATALWLENKESLGLIQVSGKRFITSTLLV